MNEQHNYNTSTDDLFLLPPLVDKMITREDLIKILDDLMRTIHKDAAAMKPRQSEGELIVNLLEALKVFK